MEMEIQWFWREVDKIVHRHTGARSESVCDFPPVDVGGAESAGSLPKDPQDETDIWPVRSRLFRNGPEL